MCSVGLSVSHMQADGTARQSGIETPQRGESVCSQSSEDDDRNDVGDAEDHNVAVAGHQ
jgi:hypothetical protein